MLNKSASHLNNGGLKLIPKSLLNNWSSTTCRLIIDFMTNWQTVYVLATYLLFTLHSYYFVFLCKALIFTFIITFTSNISRNYFLIFFYDFYWILFRSFPGVNILYIFSFILCRNKNKPTYFTLTAYTGLHRPNQTKQRRFPAVSHNWQRGNSRADATWVLPSKYINLGGRGTVVDRPSAKLHHWLGLDTAVEDG